MEGGVTESAQSSSKKARISSVAEGSSSVQLQEKLNKFEQTGKFRYGSSVDDEKINSIIIELGKSINISNLDKDYKEFLNKHGCIRGEGFYTCGPTEHITDSKKYIVSMQRGFENRCKMSKMKDEQVKSCWLMAGIDQGDEYYINLSNSGKGYIYSMSLNGKSKLFAKSFLEFLDKFFEAYERKAEKEAYEEEVYES